MGSFTNGGKEDYRVELGLRKTQLRLRPFGMDKGSRGGKALNPEKGASRRDAAHVCHHPSG
jgi:hypothetical protein